MASSKRLNATITIGGTVTGALKAALSGTQKGLQSLGSAIRDLDKRQKLLGSSIQTFARMRKDVDGLRQKYAATVTEVNRLRAAQDRLRAASEKYEARKATAGKIAAVGVGAGLAGAAIARTTIVPGIKESKGYDTEMARLRALGMGDKTNTAAEQFAREMKTYGTSQLENLTLMRDALSVLSDLHHAEMVSPMLAKMKFGNSAVFGAEHGEENEAKFMDMLKVIELRGGTNSEEDFKKQANMVQKVVSATGGRVGASEWRNVISTGGIAAKLMRDDAFYYQLEPLVQMMGGDKVGTGLSASYSSLYQGRTTKRAANNLQKYGLVAPGRTIKHDKAGQISFLNPGDLLGSDLFRQSQYEWVKQVLLPTLAKRGITDSKEIVDVIASFVSNRKGADMLAAMVMQQSIIDKDIHRNQGAQDIDQLDAAGRNIARGKELNAEAKLADLKLRVGKSILPLYSSALEIAANALERLNGFMDRNPRMAKAMVVGITAVGAALAVAAPLLIGAGGLLIGLAAVEKFGTGLSVFAGLARGAGMLTPVLTIAGEAIAAIGAVLSGPVIAAVVAVAAAGFLLWKYWQPVGAFLGGVWDGFVAGVQATLDGLRPLLVLLEPLRAAWNYLSDALQPVVKWFGSLFQQAQFSNETLKASTDIGRTVGEVLATAFTLPLKPLQLLIEGITWLSQNSGAVLDKIKGFGGKVADAASGAWDTAKEYAGGVLGVPPPVPAMAGARGGAPANDNRTYNFNVTQQPGQDSAAFARELQRLVRQQDDVKRRGTMYDAAGAH